MNTFYQELIDRIRGEIADLEIVVERTERSWAQAQEMADDQDAYLDSVALNLHTFYTGLERLFELIARHIDGSLPESKTWHHDLLLQMEDDLVGVRPAVIAHDTAISLDKFRRFRHLVRNVYTMNLNPKKMSGLMLALPGLWSGLRAELEAFADFLEELAQAT